MRNRTRFWRQVMVGVALPVLVMVGCARWSTPITTWEGESDFPEAAILEVPADIRLLVVDGRTMPRYLLESTAFVFLLRPGERHISLRYDSLWAGGLEGRASSVRSLPLELRFDAKPGVTYQLVLDDRPRSRSQAEQFAACPQIRLVEEGGDTVARLTARQCQESEAP